MSDPKAKDIFWCVIGSVLSLVFRFVEEIQKRRKKKDDNIGVRE